MLTRDFPTRPRGDKAPRRRLTEEWRVARALDRATIAPALPEPCAMSLA
jgi:hypothetical protein